MLEDVFVTTVGRTTVTLFDEVASIIVSGNWSRSQFVLLRDTTGLDPSLKWGVTLGRAVVAFCGTGVKKLLQFIMFLPLQLLRFVDGVGVSGTGVKFLWWLSALEASFGVKERAERME